MYQPNQIQLPAGNYEEDALNEKNQSSIEQCRFHQEELDSLLDHHHNSNNSKRKNTFKIIKRNSLPNYSSIHYTKLPSPTNFYYCLSCISNLNLTKHLNLVMSKNLSNELNWQCNLSTVRERNAVLFNNEYMSDVTFWLIGENKNECKCIEKASLFNDKDQLKIELSTSNCLYKIPAHKHILASASPVFHAMFYGNLAEKFNEIKLPDVERNGFLNMLRYF